MKSPITEAWCATSSEITLIEGLQLHKTFVVILKILPCCNISETLSFGIFSSF